MVGISFSIEILIDNIYICEELIIPHYRYFSSFTNSQFPEKINKLVE